MWLTERWLSQVHPTFPGLLKNNGRSVISSSVRWFHRPGAASLHLSSYNLVYQELVEDLGCKQTGSMLPEQHPSSSTRVYTPDLQEVTLDPKHPTRNCLLSSFPWQVR